MALVATQSSWQVFNQHWMLASNVGRIKNEWQKVSFAGFQLDGN